MKRIAFSVLLLFAGTNGIAQDVHLSQFYTAAQNFNPALCGNFDGTFRVAANYRSQWREISSPIKTAIIAFDRKIPFNNSELDLGLMVLNDQFSGFRLNTNKFFVTAAYARAINKHVLRAGAQTGFVMKSINVQDQTFPSQWNNGSGAFDPSASNGEVNLTEANKYVDLNAGLSWSCQFNRIKPTVGVALSHLNRPDDTYFDKPTDGLAIMQTYHTSAIIAVSEKVSMEPKLLYMYTTAAQNGLIGSNLKYHLDNSKLEAIYMGALYRDGFKRNSDAIIPVVGLNFKSLHFGVSYDINISALSQYSSQKSTLEFSLIYTGTRVKDGRESFPLF